MSASSASGTVKAPEEDSTTRGVVYSKHTVQFRKGNVEPWFGTSFCCTMMFGGMEIKADLDVTNG